MSNTFANIVRHLRLVVALISTVIAIQIVTTAQETITPLPDGSGWEIKQPDVTEPRENISEKKPELIFKKFDEVVVTGGGCVQTGGVGKTWKRYVDPAGNNSDRLYHGRIWIPGATDGLVRISSIIGIPLIINKLQPHSNDLADAYPLNLGYEDDNYPDNNYKPHNNDNGPIQCKLGGDRLPIEGAAWLNIKIIHHDSGSAPPPPDPRAPFDLWWDRVDDNFLPYNPDWWTHHHDTDANHMPVIPNSTLSTGCNSFREGPHDFLILGKSPQCTMWDPDVDEANIGSAYCHAIGALNAVHGHVNWGAVTYRGKIYYETKSIDGDYDWGLSPLDDDNKRAEIGIATGNTLPGANDPLYDNPGMRILALEFSSRETVDQMKSIATWWRNFRSNPSQAGSKIKGKEAVVIGLMGLDNEHGGSTGSRVELHPVWGMAIRISDDNATEDVWAIMARNWGNEGSCSNGFDKSPTPGKWFHLVPLPNDEMKFFLPNSFGSSLVVTTNFATDYGTPASRFNTVVLNNGVLLTVRLLGPKQKSLFWGELHIKKQ
jgi:hypothetical protein